MKRKIILVWFLIALCLVSGNFVNVNAQEQNIPNKLSATPTSIDITVPNQIKCSAVANSDELVVENLIMVNNAGIGNIKVSKISVTGINGWNIISKSSDFKKMPFNTKSISIFSANHDYITDDNTLISLAPLQSKNIPLFGKISGQATSISNADIANLRISFILEEKPILKQWNIGKPNASDVVAKLYTDGELHISGVGDTNPYIENDNGYELETVWYKDSEKITKVTMEETVQPISMDWWFKGTYFTTIDFKIPKSTQSLNGLFADPGSYRHLILDNFFIPRNVTSMLHMFRNGFINGSITIDADYSVEKLGQDVLYMFNFDSMQCKKGDVIVNYTANANVDDFIDNNEHKLGSNGTFQKGVLVPIPE
ncbi:MAG: hypothetical protein RR909_03130 [Bacilli bacterium]